MRTFARHASWLLMLLLAGPDPGLPQVDPAALWEGEPVEASSPDPLKVERRGALASEVGFGCLVTLPAEVTRVALADDSIARVQVVSPREVLLTGLTPGRTSVHIWLIDGRRFHYTFHALRDLNLLRRTLRDLDPAIEVEISPDGRTVVLHGEVGSAAVANEALSRTQSVIGASDERNEPLNLLRYPGSSSTQDDRLQEIVRTIDHRIRVRRIQVDRTADPSKDTYILEGRVRTVEALVQAVTLAERQLGGTGDKVSAIDAERVTRDRFRGFTGAGAVGTGSSGGQSASQALRGSDPRSSALSAQIARGLMITSESGRVVSLLEVDNLYQVMVSIRVLEVDRTKVRRSGFNFRIDGEHVSIGSYTGPSVNSLPSGTDPPSVTGLSSQLGNVVGAFVDQTSAIVAAIDFMQEKNFAKAVAEPNVVTLSGELASVVVGGEVPIPATSSTQVSTFQSFFFQDFGVRLDIRPTVIESGMVALEVSPSIVRPVPGLGVEGVPGFRVQSVTTTAQVPAGRSLVIGGLLSFEEGLEEQGVPGLSKIPFFRWRRRTRQERELLFLITPRLVRADAGPKVVELPDELEWPEGRSRWRDDFEPGDVGPDGISDSLRVTPALPPEPIANTEVVEPGKAKGWGESPKAAEPAVRPDDLTVGPSARPCLNLRPQPGSWEPPLDCLAPGTRLRRVEWLGGWSRVTLEDGRDGWMASRYLVPLVDATADPAPGDEDLFRRAKEAEDAELKLEQEIKALQEDMDRARQAAEPPSDG